MRITNIFAFIFKANISIIKILAFKLNTIATNFFLLINSTFLIIIKALPLFNSFI